MPTPNHAALLALVIAVACAEPPTPIQENACDPQVPFQFERSPGGVPEVSVSWVEVHACGIHLVDVREASEVAHGMVSASEHVPLDRVARAAEGWEPDAPVVFICRSGRRSARATRTLEEMGFTRVASMTGGVLAWSSAGHALDHDAVARVTHGSTEASSTLSDGPLDRTDIEAHLADPAGIGWVKAAALLMQGTQSCVDGRDRHSVVGTPGGDAGELLLALAALEEVRGMELDVDEIHQLLDAYLEAFGRFYIHTDTHALEGLEHELGLEEQDVEHLVRHPPRHLEAALLDALTSPERVGCGHLRLVLRNPEEYGVRPELTRALLRAVLVRLWRGETIDFVILEGDHHEGAVVNVRVDREVHAFTRIPRVVPHVGDHAIFVNHPEVSTWLRRENATFLFEVDPWLSAHPGRREDFLETVERLGRTQLESTLRHLATSLPVYEAHVHHDGVRVEGPLG